MERTLEHILFCDLTHVNKRIALDGFPFGIACVAAYFIKNCTLPMKVRIVKFPDDVYPIFSKYKHRIVCFSSYSWNFHLSYCYASIIKKYHPNVIVIFGGPYFPKDPDEQKEFLKEHKSIDFYIQGEGEVALLKLINNIFKANFNLDTIKIAPSPNVRTLFKGQFISHEITSRITDMQEIPSPYLMGLLDPFFEKKLVPLVQFTRGCPFSCTYCAEGIDYYNNICKRRPLNDIENELVYIAKRSKFNKVVHIADGNFGMYKDDIDIAHIMANISEKFGYPEYISVSVGKNKKQRVLEMAKILKGRLRLAGSVQSTDRHVLHNIKRKNIKIDQLFTFAETAREIGANSYSEIILGLPGDSRESFFKSVKDIADANFTHIVLYTLMLLPGSELATEKMKKQFGLVRKYRVQPLCYGKYQFNNEQFLSAEIEEVCVAHNSLSFEDYIDCRLFSFIVCLFYNDRIFSELIDVLKACSIFTYDWLFEIYSRYKSFPKSFKTICDYFKHDTSNELWNSREQLRCFLNTETSFQKFEMEELGKNLIFYYRALALIREFNTISEIAFEAAKTLLNRSPIYEKIEIDCFLNELLQFIRIRKSDLFNMNKDTVKLFNFDFMKILANNHEFNLKNILGNRKSYDYHFFHNYDQKKAIEYQINTYGEDVTGLAKAIARLPFENLYRTTKRVDN